MRPEIQFLLYAVQQRWITEDQAKELWNHWQEQKDRVGIDQFTREKRLLNEDKIRQGLEVVGMNLTTDRLSSVGEYELLEHLGSGSYGVTFRAQPELSKDNVAIKILAPRLHDDLLYLEEFIDQANAVKIHELENVATTIDSGEENNHFYIISEFVEGESLDTRVRRDGALPEKEVVQFAIELTRALVHANEKKIAHHGIRPSDIRITPEGNSQLLDMGLAKEVQDRILLQIAFDLGAEHYFAPEQTEGNKGDIRSDIFSLGAVLYFAVTGTPPFIDKYATIVAPESSEDNAATQTIPSPKTLNPEISDNLCTVLARMLARDPEDRYPSPEALQKDLKNLDADEAPSGEKIDANKTLLNLSTEEESETSSKEGEPKKKPSTKRSQKFPTNEETRAMQPRGPGSTTIRARTRPRTNRRHAVTSKKNPLVPLLSIGVPGLLVLLGLVYFNSFKKKPIATTEKIQEQQQPKATKLSPEIVAFQKELTHIFKFMNNNPSNVKEARTQLNTLQKSIKQNPILIKEIRKGYAQLAKLEKMVEDIRSNVEKEKLQSSSPVTNTVVNASFERGNGSQPEGWGLTDGKGKWESENAIDGQRCLSLTGIQRRKSSKNRGPYWQGIARPIETKQTYRVTFQFKTDQWRNGKGFYFESGYGWRIFEPDTEWTKKEFFFIEPNRTDPESGQNSKNIAEQRSTNLKLGLWNRLGKVFFDNLQIVKVSPYNKKYKNIELGVHETIKRRIYTFNPNFQSSSSNYSRCLYDFDASCTPYGWDFRKGQYVLYAHHLNNLAQKDGFLSVVTKHQARNASLKIETSKDLSSWNLLHTQIKSGNWGGPMPANLYPSKVIYLKFTATGNTRLSYYSYKSSLDGNPPTRFIGKTEFIE